MLYLYYSAPSISNGWCTLYSKHEYSFLWTRNRLWLHSVRSFFVSTQINHMRRQSSRFYSTWRQYNKLCLNLDLIYTNRLFYQVVFWQLGKERMRRIWHYFIWTFSIQGMEFANMISIHHWLLPNPHCTIFSLFKFKSYFYFHAMACYFFLSLFGFL